MIESIQDWLSNIPGDWLKDEQLECPPEFRKEENVLVYPELSKYILARLAPGGLTTQDPIKDPVLPVLIEDVKDPSGQVNQDPGRVPQVFIEGLKDSREPIEDIPSPLAEDVKDPPLPVLAEDVKAGIYIYFIPPTLPPKIEKGGGRIEKSLRGRIMTKS